VTIRRSALGVVAAALSALALPASGSAQGFMPGVTVQHLPFELSRTVPTSIEIILPRSGRDPASVVTYVPTGYLASLPVLARTRVGKAQVWLVPERNPLADPDVAEADILSMIPAETAGDRLFQACAPGPHAAVWELDLLGLLVAVDRTVENERALGSYKLQLCPSDNPVVEPPPAELSTYVYVRLLLNAVFTTPAVPGEYLWRTFVFPAPLAGPQPVVPRPLEVRARVPLPYGLTLRARFERRRRAALLQGTLTGGGHPLAAVDIWPFATRTRGAGVRIPDRRSPIRTAATGRFTARVRLARTAWVVAVAFPRPGPCGDPPGSDCLSETMSPIVASPIRVRVPPRSGR
jgi:hypothetical protein